MFDDLGEQDHTPWVFDPCHGQKLADRHVAYKSLIRTTGRPNVGIGSYYERPRVHGTKPRGVCLGVRYLEVGPIYIEISAAYL